MLNYLDGYPLELPCRYANKYACYTKVYIVSNIPVSQQFREIQTDSPESWSAFMRRIKCIVHYTQKGVDYQKVEMLSDGFFRLLDCEVIPF